ncbi:MAG TPA: hypothetical protein VIT01_13130, partial [Acidimicrobiales bacterium]
RGIGPSPGAVAVAAPIEVLLIRRGWGRALTQLVATIKLEDLGDIAGVLERANPKERAKVCADLGVTLIYRPDVGLVDVQAVPVAACAYERVGGGITPIRTRVLRGVIDLKAA